MNKAAIEKYIESEVLLGKSHQEIFNHIVAETDFNIHDVADLVRKTPTLYKRKRYNNLNLVLQSFLSLEIIARILMIVGIVDNVYLRNDFATIASLVIPILLLYGVRNYIRHAHLVTGLFMIVSGITTGLMSLNNFNFVLILASLMTLSASIIALVLNEKLMDDYILNKELLKQNPNQRVDIVTFTEPVQTQGPANF